MLALSPRLASLARVAAHHRRTITSSIKELQAAFKDPSSPFHLPPGTQGPDSPDSPPVGGGATHTHAHARRDGTIEVNTDIPIPIPVPVPTRPLTANANANQNPNPNPNQVGASTTNASTRANQGAAVIAHPDSDSHVQADDTPVNVTPTDKIAHAHAHVSPAQMQRQDKPHTQDKPQTRDKLHAHAQDKPRTQAQDQDQIQTTGNDSSSDNDITPPPERAEQPPGVVLGMRSVSAFATASLSASAPASPSEALAQARAEPGARARSQTSTWSRSAAMARAGASAKGDAEADALAAARAALIKAGLDPASFWEQRIVWGDQDSFQHVNNVRYVRFFESARIKWLESLGTELGGRERAEAMIRGQGVSLILKSIEVRFRRPVTYPDTLVIGYKPVLPSRSVLSTSSVLSVPSELSAPMRKGECQEMGYGNGTSQCEGRGSYDTPDEAHQHHGGNGDDRTTFEVVGRAWSVRQGAFVAHAKEALVWYDYGALKKCDPGEAAWRVVVGGRRGEVAVVGQ